jgi:hypothetical protein
LIDAGFEHVEVIDSGSDLNAYAKMGTQSGCFDGNASVLPLSNCCCNGGAMETAPTVGGNLSDLLSRYNVNNYAASVRVFAVKPK